jgi:hypothetical protein
VEYLAIPLHEALGSCLEVRIFSNAVDLDMECVDDELIDTDALGSGNCLRLIGQVIREANGSLLGHEVMIS